ncbi:MAG: hypothetical protein OXJ90_07160 [Spirochaetaceae bacterium]|nr:hypothetical protein [Spirochaetaceae bacterium]
MPVANEGMRMRTGPVCDGTISSRPANGSWQQTAASGVSSV